MKFNQRDVRDLEVSLNNYREFWRCWLANGNDGSCEPIYIEANIKSFEALVCRIKEENTR